MVRESAGLTLVSYFIYLQDKATPPSCNRYTLPSPLLIAVTEAWCRCRAKVYTVGFCETSCWLQTGAYIHTHYHALPHALFSLASFLHSLLLAPLLPPSLSYPSIHPSIHPPPPPPPSVPVTFPRPAPCWHISTAVPPFHSSHSPAAALGLVCDIRPPLLVLPLIRCWSLVSVTLQAACRREHGPQ